MTLLNDWYDWWRIVNLAMCLISIFFLTKSFVKASHQWPGRSLDRWYAFLMWSIAGALMSIDGIVQDLPLGSRTMFVMIASIVTLKYFLRPDDREKLDDY